MNDSYMRRNAMASNVAFCSIVFGILLKYSTANAAVDCGKHPNYQVIATCCEIPEANLLQFSECTPYALERPSNTACFIQCVFNTTGAMQNGQYNAINMRETFLKIYNGQQDIAEAFASSMNECHPIIQKRLKEFKVESVNNQCTEIANLYLMCGFRKTFINCPKAYWTESNDCDSVKEFFNSCDLLKPI